MCVCVCVCMCVYVCLCVSVCVYVCVLRERERERERKKEKETDRQTNSYLQIDGVDTSNFSKSIYRSLNLGRKLLSNTTFIIWYKKLYQCPARRCSAGLFFLKQNKRTLTINHITILVINFCVL